MLAGFELDIPARRSIDQQVFDFEIDGPHHDEPCQQRSDRIRDKFLRKNNINTVRIKGDITDENITEAASRAGITVDTTQLAVQRASTVSTA
jgi:very-short-patch-repair endonuclease